MNQILLLVTCIIELYIAYDFFGAFLMKRESFSDSRKVFLVFIATISVHYIVNMFHLSVLNMLALPIILVIFTSVIFVDTWKEKMLYILFLCSIFWGCEFLFVILLELSSLVMKGNSVSDLASIPWHIFTLLLLKYLVCNIFRQFSKKSKSRIDNKIYVYYLFIPIASLGIMFLTYYAGVDFNGSLHTKIMLCVYFAVMQIGNILIFYAFQRYSEELYYNMQQKWIITEQDMKLEHYTKVQAMEQRYREMIHNTNHYMKTIGALIQEQNTEAALKIIRELNIQLEKDAKIFYSGNHVVNTVLSDKKSLAEQRQVDMDIYVEPGVKFGTVMDMDLITILCNLLDNAIEAAEQCTKSRFVRIRMYMENQGNLCVTKIVNSYNGKLIQHRQDFISTKKEKGIHGVGLKSARDTAKRNGGCLECYEEDSCFVAVLLLPGEGAQ